MIFGSFGSVNVQFEVVLSGDADVDPDTLKDKFIEAVQSGRLGNFTLDTDASSMGSKYLSCHFPAGLIRFLENLYYVEYVGLY